MCTPARIFIVLRSVFFILLGLSVALLSCSKDRPAPVAPAGKSLASLAAPAAPTNLRFDAPTDSSCTVRWDASDGATDYDVNYKPAVGGRWTNEPHRGIGLSNTIHDLQPNTEYRWAVRAENSDGTSAWVFGSNFTTLPENQDGQDGGEAVLALEKPASPTNLRFDAPTDSSCTVRWDASDGAADYDINYKLASGGRWINEPHAGDGLHNTIHDLQPNTEYRWAVRAENSDGTSEWVFGPNFTTLPEDQDGQDGGEAVSDITETASSVYTEEEWVYWWEYKDLTSKLSIWRANLDGSNATEILFNQDLRWLESFTLDVNRDLMYWSQGDNPASIWRANLDGSNATEILSESYPFALGHPPLYLDVAGGWIFWVEQNRSTDTYVFYRTSLDGNNTEHIDSGVPISSRGTFRIIGVFNGSTVYWRDECRSGSSRCGSRFRVALVNFDTNIDADRVKRLPQAEGSYFWPDELWHVTEDYMYWNSSGNYGRNDFRGLWRTNLDGSNATKIDHNTVNIQSFTLDAADSRMCWLGGRAGSAIVQCTSLDGASVEDVFNFDVWPTWPVFLDMDEDRVFWVELNESREIGFDIEYSYSLWQVSRMNPIPEVLFSKVSKNVSLRVQLLALGLHP